MRNFIGFGAFAFGFSSVIAQPQFQHIYQSATGYSLDIIELPGHNLLTALGGTLMLNSEGFVTHASSLYNYGTYGAQTIMTARGNEYYFTSATIAAPCEPGSTVLSLIRPVLGKMDSLGAVLQMKRYAFEPVLCQGSNGGLEITSDKGALTWGRDRSFFALRVDSTLEPVWAKEFIGPGGFQFIKELPEGDLVAGINLQGAGAVVARLDAEGSILWVKSYMRPRGMVHDALIEPDGSMVILGMTDSLNISMFETLPVWYQPKLFMMKLNGDGQVLWCKGWRNADLRWFPHRPSRIKRTLDGQYAVLATLGMPQNNLEYRPILMKTDVNGDTIWTRSVGADGYIYMARSLLVHSDSGFAFSGIVQGALPNNNTGLCYIFKSDPLGHFECHEQHYPLETMQLFPMDSSITIAVEQSVAAAVAIYANDSVVNPDLFTEYDACSIGTDLSSHGERRAPMSIRPNPNTGHFTLSFADPLMAESYYSVYDTMGKLLFQRPLPQGKATEEVDLSRFGAGTYVVRVTSKEGSCYERVVVE
jgi:hypothetical protein